MNWRTAHLKAATLICDAMTVEEESALCSEICAFLTTCRTDNAYHSKLLHDCWKIYGGGQAESMEDALDIMTYLSQLEINHE